MLYSHRQNTLVFQNRFQPGHSKGINSLLWSTVKVLSHLHC
ncbi:hypothetical protein HMPREF3233_01680 [Veillonella atypica]|uniref:Uncharacterized protein n=1 Tax=Veillonella atypica TaxID=39777 RepID=A0A133S1G4_9FIRM|nr:hypothetical protein HMPREF3233_01680 [Veillonella atypica]